jgi:hypothetical protein
LDELAQPGNERSQVALTIDGHTRIPLFYEAMVDLAEIEQIKSAVMAQDFERTRSLSHWFRVNMDLLDELGWDPMDEREQFELRMEPQRLREIMERFLARADEALAKSSRRPSGAGLAVENLDKERKLLMDRDLEVRHACRVVLDQLGRVTSRRGI